MRKFFNYLLGFAVWGAICFGLGIAFSIHMLLSGWFK